MFFTLSQHVRDLSREIFRFRQKVTFTSLSGGNCTIELPKEGKYAVGFLFLPPDIVERENVQRHFERIIEANGQSVPVEIAGTERVVPAQAVDKYLQQA